MAGFLREMKRKDKEGKEYSYWVAVKTYRDRRSGKVKHKILQTFGRLSEKETENLRALRQLKDLGEDALVTTWQQIKIGASYDYLTIIVLDRLYRMWGLDKAISSGRSLTDKDTGRVPLVPLSVMAEILTLNRALSPNSDYFARGEYAFGVKVSHWYQTTMLPRILATKSALVNPTRIYRSLDEIYLQEEEIQKHLAEKIPALDFDDLSLILYDITSTYFEGYHCPIAKFGLSRDHRKDRPQVLLALAVTKEGFPFFWRVLSGEIHDSATAKETVSALKERFCARGALASGEKIDKICLVMDKGMVNT